jgi:hypothetical protein
VRLLHAVVLIVSALLDVIGPPAVGERHRRRAQRHEPQAPPQMSSHQTLPFTEVTRSRGNARGVTA